MVEFLIVALLIVAHRLRRASREPRVPVELHIYYHFEPGPGERQPDAVDDGDITASSNVVRFRRTGRER